MDATTLGLQPVLRACWMQRGVQKRIPTPGQQQWHHLIGAYNFVTDAVMALPVVKKNSDGFIEFLDSLARDLPIDRPIFLVLDNASYHHSAATQAAFALLEDRLCPLFLPPYCSNLNLIERFWLHLKGLVANALQPSLTALGEAVQTHLLNQNDPHHPDHFTLCKIL